jgi:hypothetical protein
MTATNLRDSRAPISSLAMLEVLGVESAIQGARHSSAEFSTMPGGVDLPGGGSRRRNSVAPNPWRRGRRRPSGENAREREGAGDPANAAPLMMAGLFADAKHAERAYQALFARGYRPDEVIVVIPESTWHTLFAADADANASEGKGTQGTKYQTSAGEFPVPVAVPLSSRAESKRVMAAGRIAALLSSASRQPGGEELTTALAACGIPHRLTRDCAAGIEEGKILLGVIPRSADDVASLGDEWTRRHGEVLER